MFETETMAELCIKQGLIREALAIYRRLVAAAPDPESRARRARRIGELEASAPGQATPARPAPAKMTMPTAGALSQPGIQARHDGGQVTLEWRLPADTHAPALQILVLRRAPSGIATEQRTLPVDSAEGRMTLPMAGVHTLRAAAGRLDGERFVPVVRLDQHLDP